MVLAHCGRWCPLIASRCKSNTVLPQMDIAVASVRERSGLVVGEKVAS